MNKQEELNKLKEATFNLLDEMKGQTESIKGNI